MDCCSSPPTSFVQIAQDHFVCLGFPAWGHCKGLVALAIKIIQARPNSVIITFFTFKTLYSRILDEIARRAPEGDGLVHKQFRLIGLIGEVGTDGFPTVDKEFLLAYKQMCDSKPIQCAHTGTTYGAQSIPKAVIIDALGYESIIGMRKINPNGKVYVWVCTSAAGVLRMSGPKELGGLGDQLDLVNAEVQSTGKSTADVADEYLRRADGSVIHVPGLPPMYDHEFTPQEVPFVKGASYLRLAVHRGLLASDCVIVNSFDNYERESLQAMREWLAKTMSIDLFAMAFPEPHTSKAEESGEVHCFLEEVIQRRGEGSLVYMSLGTLFWPTKPEMVWCFIETMMQMDIPFIFSHASEVARVPEDVSLKVQEYELGIIMPWAPQNLILSHPATGVFVTHGGQNSTLEALLHGIPMIFWPFDCDQPTNAIHSTNNLEISYELHQVRSGKHGLGPILHLEQKGDQTDVECTVEAVSREARSILEKAFDADGGKKRQNIRKFSDILKTGWDPRHGMFTQELERFLEYALI